VPSHKLFEIWKNLAECKSPKSHLSARSFAFQGAMFVRRSSIAVLPNENCDSQKVAFDQDEQALITCKPNDATSMISKNNEENPVILYILVQQACGLSLFDGLEPRTCVFIPAMDSKVLITQNRFPSFAMTLQIRTCESCVSPVPLTILLLNRPAPVSRLQECLFGTRSLLCPSLHVHAEFNSISISRTVSPAAPATSLLRHLR
jgi:hypothetical protein